jgi:Cu/Ag efflux pump CusA
MRFWRRRAAPATDPDDHGGDGAGRIAAGVASGAGAEARQEIGWTIVGGLAIGTFFTLFVVPAFYVTLATWRGRTMATA